MVTKLFHMLLKLVGFFLQLLLRTAVIFWIMPPDWKFTGICVVTGSYLVVGLAWLVENALGLLFQAFLFLVRSILLGIYIAVSLAASGGWHLLIYASNKLDSLETLPTNPFHAAWLVDTIAAIPFLVQSFVTHMVGRRTMYNALQPIGKAFVKALQTIGDFAAFICLNLLMLSIWTCDAAHTVGARALHQAKRLGRMGFACTNKCCIQTRAFAFTLAMKSREYANKAAIKIRECAVKGAIQIHQYSSKFAIQARQGAAKFAFQTRNWYKNTAWPFMKYLGWMLLRATVAVGRWCKKRVIQTLQWLKNKAFPFLGRLLLMFVFAVILTLLWCKNKAIPAVLGFVLASLQNLLKCLQTVVCGCASMLKWFVLCLFVIDDPDRCEYESSSDNHFQNDDAPIAYEKAPIAYKKNEKVFYWDRHGNRTPAKIIQVVADPFGGSADYVIKIIGCNIERHTLGGFLEPFVLQQPQFKKGQLVSIYDKGRQRYVNVRVKDAFTCPEGGEPFYNLHYDNKDRNTTESHLSLPVYYY